MTNFTATPTKADLIYEYEVLTDLHIQEVLRTVRAGPEGILLIADLYRQVRAGLHHHDAETLERMVDGLKITLTRRFPHLKDRID
jgi:hypothetical protein